MNKHRLPFVLAIVLMVSLLVGVTAPAYAADPTPVATPVATPIAVVTPAAIPSAVPTPAFDPAEASKTVSQLQKLLPSLQQIIDGWAALVKQVNDIAAQLAALADQVKNGVGAQSEGAVRTDVQGLLQGDHFVAQVGTKGKVSVFEGRYYDGSGLKDRHDLVVIEGPREGFPLYEGALWQLPTAWDPYKFACELWRGKVANWQEQGITPLPVQFWEWKAGVKSLAIITPDCAKLLAPAPVATPAATITVLAAPPVATPVTAATKPPAPTATVPVPTATVPPVPTATNEQKVLAQWAGLLKVDVKLLSACTKVVLSDCVHVVSASPVTVTIPKNMFYAESGEDISASKEATAEIVITTKEVWVWVLGGK